MKNANSTTLRERHECQTLISFTSFLPENSDLCCRAWHFLNGTVDAPRCKMCNKSVLWKKNEKRYNTWCPAKCRGTDPEIKEKRKNTINMHNNGYSRIWDCGKLRFVKN